MKFIDFEKQFENFSNVELANLVNVPEATVRNIRKHKKDLTGELALAFTILVPEIEGLEYRRLMRKSVDKNMLHITKDRSNRSIREAILSV